MPKLNYFLPKNAERTYGYAFNQQNNMSHKFLKFVIFSRNIEIPDRGIQRRRLRECKALPAND